MLKSKNLSRGFTQHHFFKKSGAGFTIIEVLIAGVIIAILSAMLFFNFRSSSSNATARNQTVAAIEADIRRAQTMATNSTSYQGTIVCGYGVHYLTSTSYRIYARQKPANSACASSGSRNYGQGAAGYTDATVQDITIANPNFAIKSTACPASLQGSLFTGSGNDIFFEPPDPKTYLANKSLPDNNLKNILIGVDLKSASGCAGKYATIIVSPGAIDIQYAP